jgi:hypothetical protein
MAQSILNAITLHTAEGSDENITKIINEEGVVNIPAHVLKAVAGDLFRQAHAEAQALYDAQFKPGGEKWPALFHERQGPGGKLRAGDLQKTMSPRLGDESMIVQFLLKAVAALSPGFSLGRDPDGLYHVVLLHHSEKDLFSSEHYTQEVHHDLPCHGAGQHFSKSTIEACGRQDGPRVMWVSLNKDPIALYFYLRSHRISLLVNEFFVHYAPLWKEYSRTHPTSKEEDFQSIWAVFVEKHVQEELERLQIRVNPEAVLHSVEPCGAAMWHALTGHGGTSQEGLRIFTILVKEEYRKEVELPQSSIELMRDSRIYAGVMDVILRPLDVALASKKVADELANLFAGAVGAGITRSASSHVKDALLQVMDNVRLGHGVRPIPDHVDNLKPVILQFPHATRILGLVCNTAGRGKVVLWLELNLKDSHVTKGTLFRGAAFAQELIESQDRRALDASRALSRFLEPRRCPVTTVAFSVEADAYSLLYSPVLMDGEPLKHRLQRDFKLWRDRRELDESGRYALAGLFQLSDRLGNYGYRQVLFDPNLFCIDAHDRVKLMFAGGGFLGQKTQPQCNRKQHLGGFPLIRRSTSADKDARFRMNVRRIEEIQSQGPSQLEAAQRGDQDTDADPGQATAAFKEWSDSDLRNWSKDQRGRCMGVLGRWNAKFEDLVADDYLIADLKAATKVDHIMELLRLTDVHQMMVWLVCELREASCAGETWTDRKERLKYVFEKCDSMEDLIQGMQNFVLGLSPERPKLSRAAESKPSLPCNQPAALNRLLEMVIFSLHPAYREDASKELSYMLFLTTAVFNPGDELLLTGEGIRMDVRLYPFDDPVFQGKASAALRRAGAKGLDKFPRTMLLRNEGQFGVGVFAPGEYKKGDFIGFYLGTVEEDPHGRHVVSSMGKGEAKYCNGGNRRCLPVSAHIKLGTPGSYMNSSQGRFNEDGSPLKPNAAPDQNHLVLHTHEGMPMSLIPLFASYDFAKAFVVWDYDPNARRGASFRS